MEFGKFIAYFTADTSNFDRGARGVAAKAAALNSTFSSLTGGVGSASSALSGLASPMALVAGGAVVAASAIGGVVVGLFDLVKSSAKAGGDLYDLSQKTGLAVETLSTLSIVAQTTGSTIEGISASLGIFQKNMEAAHVGTEKQSKLFKSLNIDTQDNEKALRQAFTALGSMTEGAHQTAVAMQLFGRSGKDVLAIVKESNGDLDAATKKYAAMGLVISTDAARASDKFNDLLQETELQLSAVTRTIGMEVMPVFTDALKKISSWLVENKDAWRSWGTTIADVMRGIAVIVNSEAVRIAAAIADLNPMLQALISAGKFIASLGAQSRGGLGPYPGYGVLTDKGLREQQFNALAAKAISNNRFSGGGVGGGGGKGGGGGGDPAASAKRMAELQLAAVVDGLKRESDANRSALERRQRDFNQYATQYMVIEERRHAAVIRGLDAEQKAAEQLKKGGDVALQEIANKRTVENTTYEQNRNKVLDERGKILDEINKFIRDQERDIAGVTSQTDQWEQAYNQLVDTLKDEGVVLEDNTRKRIKSNIEILREIDLVKSATRAREVLRSVRDRIVTRDMKERGPGIDSLPDATRERIVTGAAAAAHDRITYIREQMKQLAGDLTDIFSRSISDGFNNGIKSGLQTLAQGLLQIVEQIFLKRLAEGLSQLLGNLATGGTSGKGGFLGAILNGIIGGLGGAVGGGGATPVPGHGTLGGPTIGGVSINPFARAAGGPVSAMSPYMVGERGPELFVPSSSGNIVPNGKMGQTVIHNYNTFNFQASGNSSVSAKRSARQQAEFVMAALQGAQA